MHVLEVSGCLLSLAFHGDLLCERTAANKIFQRISRLSQIGRGQLMSMFADIEPLHKAAKGTSTLAGQNIYRQLHLCTVFVENHICIWLWFTGIWGWHWLLICGFTNICYHSFLSSFCICNFSCRSFPGRRFSLEGCLLF